MAENYKHLYEQMKKMVAMYQDEIVPGMREQLEKHKWIPVTERLPEKDGRYLTINEHGMVYDAEYSRFYKGFGEKNEFDDGTDYFMQDIGITHWMPLPEPPKGE